MRKIAFTLIEMLTVLAIILLLAAIMFPIYRGVREKTFSARCASQLHQMGVAMRMYVDDYDGRFPIGAYNSLSPSASWDISWHDLLLPYLDWKCSLFVCPSLARNGGYRESYGSNPWLSCYYGSASIASLRSGDRIWAADHETGDWPIWPWDYYNNDRHSYFTDRHFGKTQVLYVDGHVALLHPGDALLRGGLWIP